MSHTPHQLAQEFPEHAEAISALKTSDAHFAKLVEAYNEVNQQVHLAETNVQPMEQLAEEQLRKERTKLKDEIYAILSKAAAV
ncbi:YdcH family protein [Donghicola sp. C2-DW-16]|uniref:YdcH family protein n=1 Tax=Donghicola mangrovi TaxID=2729614 RepID=A0A850Q8V0_9RHOB|nr:YdcH family protein [Donghicola mangrovi]NVO23398.1 YdcH family protein [Donghicola mangrovi]NVO27144.1 YdcH family protein [Donghicola mangrovi]